MKSKIATFFKMFFAILGVFTLIKAAIEGEWLTLIAFFGLLIFVCIKNK